MAVKMTHERPVRLRPLRRHAVARQVARHQIEQPGHRRRAGEPQNRDRAQVVDGAERLAEMLDGRDRRARGRTPGRPPRTPPAESAAS